MPQLAERVRDNPRRSLERGRSAPSDAPLARARQSSEGVRSESAQARVSNPVSHPSAKAVLHSGGRPLEPSTRSFMEARFGHDFSSVRVHSDEAAAKSAVRIDAAAYTVGHNVVFAKDRYAPETGEGRRLIAHELAHVVQADRAASHEPSPVETLELEAGRAADAVARGEHAPPIRGAASSQAAPLRQPPTFGNLPQDAPEPAGSRLVILSAKDGKWTEFAPNRSPQTRTATGSYDFVVAEDGGIRAVRSSSRYGHTEAARGGRVIWAGQIKFSKSGQLKEWTNQSGHYLPQGGFPENAVKANPNLDLQRYRKAVSGSVVRPDEPGGRPSHREGPQLPVIQEETKPRPKSAGLGTSATTSEESHAAPTAEPAPSIARQSPSVSTSSSAGSGRQASATSGAAQDLATELFEKESSSRWMARATDLVHVGLTVWSALDVLETTAKALNMSAATLAQGSPFYKEINAAYAIEAKAKEVKDYYDNLNVAAQMPAEGDPEWGSEYELTQSQNIYHLIDYHLEESQKSVEAVLSDLDKQLDDLQEGMDSRIKSATFFPVTSLVYADLMLFVDAARRIVPSLKSARESYKDALQWIKFQRRMGTAAIKRLQARLDRLEFADQFEWMLRRSGADSLDAQNAANYIRALPLR